MQDLTPGQTISQRFTLIRRLAQEGGLTVWLASADEGSQQVLLRFFSGIALADLPAELKSEVRRAERIVHPSLVRCLGLYEHGASALLAHEFTPESNALSTLGGDYRNVLPALMPVAEALAYLHDLGLAHGGVDEAFLRIDASGNVCLDGIAVSWVEARHVPLPRADISAFGALLGRLIGVQTGTPLPDTLATLLNAMQSDSGSVTDMHEVVRRIARALNMDSNSAPHVAPLQGAAAGAVAPRARSDSHENPRTQGRTARPGISMAIALPALLVMVAIVVYVMFFLPRPAVQQPTVAMSGETPAGTAQGGPVSTATTTTQAASDVVAPFAAAAAARLRQEAQDAAMSLLRSLVALEERGVSQWAPKEFADARVAGDEGDALYRAQDFEAALTRYREGLQLAESMIGRSGDVLQAAIADGNAALASGDGEQARQQFALALAIDDESPQAQAGVKRAEKLGAVLERMRLAKEAEQAGNYTAARDYYREAVALDANYQAAGDALKRVQGLLGARSFQNLMSRGFGALDDGDTDAARRYFEQAAKLRPGASGPGDALAQVAARLRDSDIATRRSAAAAAEQDENWTKAVATYRSILNTDNTLVFAVDGLARAEQRALLSERMQRYIDEPLRMFDNQAYNEARAALAQARTISSPGPRLAQQIEALGALVSVARLPVVVQLNSDGLTRVSIHKIGEIGTFQQQSVGLIPGRYTAVGSRAGYRDVRREFDVRAGKPPSPVTIVCEEPV